MNSDEYKLIFFDIINGYSCASLNSQPLFIKHFSYIDNASFEVKYNNFLNEAIDQGIKTYPQKEKEIIDDGLWIENDNLELAQNEKFLQDLRINLSKDYLYSRRIRIKKDIQIAEQRIEALRIKKAHYIGHTAEEFANKKLIYYKIIHSFYLDNNLKSSFIQNDEIDDDRYNLLINIYYNILEKFNSDNLKKIALLPFFTNIFYLSQDDAYSFYGKPIINLTTYQTDIFILGRYFKNILSQYGDSIPKTIYENADDILEWIEIHENAEKQGIIGKDIEETGASSIIGATSKDMQMLGLQPNQLFNLHDKLKEKGGALTSSDLYTLHNG